MAYGKQIAKLWKFFLLSNYFKWIKLQKTETAEWIKKNILTVRSL